MVHETKVALFFHYANFFSISLLFLTFPNLMGHRCPACGKPQLYKLFKLYKPTLPSIYKTKKRPNLSHEMGVFPLSRHFFFCLYIGTIITPFLLRLIDFSLMRSFRVNRDSGSSLSP